MAASKMLPEAINQVNLGVIFTWEVELVTGLHKLEWSVSSINNLMHKPALKLLVGAEILAIAQYSKTKDLNLSEEEIPLIDDRIPRLTALLFTTADIKDTTEFLLRIKLLSLMAQGHLLDVSVSMCQKAIDLASQLNEGKLGNGDDLITSAYSHPK